MARLATVRRMGAALLGLTLATATVGAGAQERPTMNGRLGPPTPETCFWSTREYADLPERGPAEAAGIVLWNHGQAGDGRPNWQHGPAPVIRQFAERGWDVWLVQRNERCQGSWERKGAGYVANLLRDAERAKDRGYKRVLVAGQSYGAGTALAAGRSEKVDGVLALALSHGRGSCRDPRTFRPEMVPQQERHIREGIAQVRAPRVLVSMGKDDHCVGHSFTPLIAGALAERPIAYIHFDEASMPFSGHGAAMHKDFAAMFGQCIYKFFTQDPPPPHGRTVCTPR